MWRTQSDCRSCIQLPPNARNGPTNVPARQQLPVEVRRLGPDAAPSDCGRRKHRWVVNWQITPRTLTEALAAGGDEAARAFAAMITMPKIDHAVFDAARRG